MNEVSTIAAIDVHGHYGAFKNTNQELVARFRSGDAEVVAERARVARTALTIVSPLQALMPRNHNDAVGGNEDAATLIAQHPTLRFWVVIDPRKPETYEQAKRMLRQPECVGIKIHPEEHVYPISEHGEAIFRFAAERGAVVLTHSGEQNSLPEDFVPFLNAIPEAKLILAHLGCGWDGDPSHQVRAIQSSLQGNVWVDTSSVQSVSPGLIEWAVEEIGAERLLYGTDTPLYHASMQRIRIDDAEISDADKRLILRDNALKLLPLGLDS
jgi:predicted TIM-barrel fold metal-dependent hydrolase